MNHRNRTRPKTSCTSVTAVVLNWNGAADTMRCLSSLVQLDYQDLHVVVVDNGSTDDSAALIKTGYPSVEVIETHANLGFAGGCNVGILTAMKRGSEFVWLLNNDTVVESGALTAMVNLALSDAHVAGVGSILRDLEEPHAVQAWGGGTIVKWAGRSQHRKGPGRLDYVSGASLLLRTEALNDVGLLDEGFFFYWEDTDLCMRLRINDWRLSVAEDATIYHADAGTLGRLNPLRAEHYYYGLARFLRKYSPAPRTGLGLALLERAARSAARNRWALLAGALKGARTGASRRPRTRPSDGAPNPSKFSLIVGTRGRVSQLERLLDSVSRQTHRDVEVIIVDQNGDDRLHRTLVKFEGILDIVYVAESGGASEARNLGLAIATGDVITFPDDDCWYPVGLLAKVRKLLSENPTWDGVATKVADDVGASPGRWNRSEGFVDRSNAWTSAVAFTFFLRRNQSASLRFDPVLGPGPAKEWPSGEDTDFVLKAVEAGVRLWYTPSLIVHHDQVDTTISRALHYGRGMGYVLRKHGYPVRFFAYYLLRAAVGTVLSLLRFRWKSARVYAASFGGRLIGWIQRGRPHMGRPTGSVHLSSSEKS